MEEAVPLSSHGEVFSVSMRTLSVSLPLSASYSPRIGRCCVAPPFRIRRVRAALGSALLRQRGGVVCLCAVVRADCISILCLFVKFFRLNINPVLLRPRVGLSDERFDSGEFQAELFDLLFGCGQERPGCVRFRSFYDARRGCIHLRRRSDVRCI